MVDLELLSSLVSKKLATATVVLEVADIGTELESLPVTAASSWSSKLSTAAPAFTEKAIACVVGHALMHQALN